jgi:hypothetical protein
MEWYRNDKEEVALRGGERPDLTTTMARGQGGFLTEECT